ncbi:MAG TPA: hypothetical protein VGE07_16705 [Herpetosiphonaceae bacterium]
MHAHCSRSWLTTISSTLRSFWTARPPQGQQLIPRQRRLGAFLALILMLPFATAAHPQQRVASGERELLPPTMYVTNHGFTPDSQAIVAVTRDSPYPPAAGHLYHVSLADNPPTRISAGLNAHGFRITSDSRTVIFHSLGLDGRFANLHSVPLTGTTPIQLNPSQFTGQVGGYQLTPDEQSVIYETTWPHEPALYHVPLTGGPSIRLTPSLPGSWSLSRFFATTNDHVVCWMYAVQESGPPRAVLYSIPRRGGPPVVLADYDDIDRASFETQNITFSPDGNYVVYYIIAGGQGRLESVPINGPTPIDPRLQLHTAPITANHMNGGAAKGRVILGPELYERVVFTTQKWIPTQALTKTMVYSVGIRGDAPLQLSHDSMDSVLGVTIAANNQTIVFTTGFVERRLNVYRTTITGEDLVQVNPSSHPFTQYPSGVVISPNSAHIAYGYDGYLLTTPVSATQVLTQSLDTAGTWAFTANNHALIYTNWRRTGLFMAPLAGSPSRLLRTDSSGLISYSVAPFGSNIAYNRELRGLYLLNLANLPPLQPIYLPLIRTP